MATQAVANLIQGVSQQAAQQRRDTQCEAQFDCFNSVSEGAGARPPAELIKAWAGRTLTGAFFSEWLRDDENYLFGVYNGAVFAINLDSGVDATIPGTHNADGYLTLPSGDIPADTFRVQVVEDTAFLTSRRIAPAMASTKSAVSDPQALVFVRSGAYDNDFTVTLSGPAAATKTVHTSATVLAQASTGYIAEELRTALHGTNGYSCERSGSTLRIWRADKADFNIETSDDNGDTFMYAFKDKATSYTKLPARAFAGFKLKVAGESRTVADDFYVEYMGQPSTGYWQEIVKPDTKTTLDKTKMPHVLKLTALDTFTYGSVDWSTRIAGDEVTAKEPSFVGKMLRDVFHHENRLALLYNGGVVWSKTRFPFTWFPDTAQVVLDTAPVDAKLVPPRVSRGTSDMDFAVQIDEALFLWSARTQFRITSGQDNFKQDTVAANPGTSYEYAKACDPLALGQFLYFATDVGLYATVRSVQFQSGKPNGDIDVTAHVGHYLASGVRWLTASDTLGAIFVVSAGDPDVIYSYNFLFQGQEYLQSAWNTWRLPGGSILWAGVRDTRLRVLQQRPEGVALLSFNLTPKSVDAGVTGAKYLTRLDLRVSEGQVTGLAYDSVTGTSEFTLPYAPTGPELRVITREDKSGGYTRGRAFEVVSVVGAVVTVKGNLTGYKFYAGQRIDSRRTESRFYVRNEKGVLPTDRLTVEDFTVEMADTGYTRIEVATPNKATRSYEWEGRTAGLPGSDLGSPVLRTDSLTAKVSELAENATITLVNDSFLPSYWQSASYSFTAVGKGGQR